MGWYSEGEEVNFSDLLGKVVKKIEKSHDEVVFHVEDGVRYKMYHQQDCCEDVWVEDVIGNLEYLIGSPITMAEEETNNDNPLPDGDYSQTWTFYKLATNKGYVTIRWYGTSNGYYSESVDFVKITNESQ